MALEGLVHGEVATCFGALRAVVKLEDLEQTILTAARNPALILIPGHTAQTNPIGDRNFLAEVHKHFCSSTNLLSAPFPLLLLFLSKD